MALADGRQSAFGYSVTSEGLCAHVRIGVFSCACSLHIYDLCSLILAHTGHTPIVRGVGVAIIEGRDVIKIAQVKSPSPGAQASQGCDFGA